MSEEITILISSDPPPKPSILRVPSTSRLTSSASSPTPSNISFAPLPKVDGKKRRNRRPIGLAGRAELLQVSRRRLLEAASDDDNYYGVEYSSYNEEEEIPLPDIGKLVKGLWRNISRISNREKQVQSTPQPVPTSRDNPGSALGTDTRATSTGMNGEVNESRSSATDHSEIISISPSSREIPPPEPEPPSTDAQDIPQIQISAISTASPKELDVLPKGIDDLIQVSVFNTLKVQNS